MRLGPRPVFCINFSQHVRPPKHDSREWRKKLLKLLLRLVVSRIVFRAEGFQSKRPHRGDLREVLAGFRPVEMGRVTGENDHGAGRIGFRARGNIRIGG